MELLPVALLSATIGIGVGLLFGFLMSQKRSRAHILEAGAAARAATQNLASVVAAPTVTIEDLRKLLTDRDDTLQQSRNDLQKTNQQLEAANATAETVATLRTQLDQRTTELAIQANAFTEQMRDLVAKTKGDSVAVEEASRQVASLEVQLDLEKRQGRELTDQISRLTSELTAAKSSGSDVVTQLEAQILAEKKVAVELNEQIARMTSDLTGSRVAGADAVAQVEARLEAEKKHTQELVEQVAVLRIDLEQARQFGADAEGYRSTLETELGVNRLKIMQLADQVAELNRERSQFEVRIREERQSAARGIELLTLAQNTLTGALTRLQEENQMPEAPAPAPRAQAPAPPKVAKAEPLPPSPVVEHHAAPEHHAVVEQRVEELVPVPVGDAVGVSA